MEAAQKQECLCCIVPHQMSPGACRGQAGSLPPCTVTGISDCAENARNSTKVWGAPAADQVLPGFCATGFFLEEEDRGKAGHSSLPGAFCIFHQVVLQVSVAPLAFVSPAESRMGAG